MTPMPWFRVYSEILNDRKIKRICKKTRQSKALVIGVWICLLALANDSPDRGRLELSEDMPYTLEELEEETQVPYEILAQLMDEFRQHDMINGKTTIEISNWTKRQFKSDNVAERVAKHRDKVKRYSNVIEQKQIQIQNRAEEEVNTTTTATIFDMPRKPGKSAELMLLEAGGISSIPANHLHRIGQVEDMATIHGDKITEEALRDSRDRYCKTRGKNGKPYSVLSFGWVDWAQEQLDNGTNITKELTRMEYEELSTDDKLAYIRSGKEPPSW